MTATYGAISAVPYTSHTNTVITPPASIGDGDLLLLIQITAALTTAPTATLPAGFTQIGSTQIGNDNGGFQYRFIQAYKIASSESGSYTVTHATCSSAGAVIRIDGSGTLSVDVQSQNKLDGIGDGTTIATSVTTTVANDLLVYVGLNWIAAAMTPPSGMTEQLDSTLVYVATEALGAAGATGTRTQTHPTNPWFGNLIAIKDVGTSALTVTGAQTTNEAVTAGTLTLGDVAPPEQPTAPGGPSRAAQRRLKKAIENRSRFEAERARRLANLTNDRPLFVTPPETLKIINETLVEDIDHAVLFENEDQDEELLLLLMMI